MKSHFCRFFLIKGMYCFRSVYLYCQIVWAVITSYSIHYTKLYEYAVNLHVPMSRNCLAYQQGLVVQCCQGLVIIAKQLKLTTSGITKTLRRKISKARMASWLWIWSSKSLSFSLRGTGFMDTSGRVTGLTVKPYCLSTRAVYFTRFYTLIIFAVLILATNGCMPTIEFGIPPQTDRLDQLTIDVSTSQDVKAILGEPQGLV